MDASDLATLNDIRVKNPNKMILCNLNINSIRNKIDILASLVRGMVDIMLISESKIDDLFPTNQFLLLIEKIEMVRVVVYFLM